MPLPVILVSLLALVGWSRAQTCVHNWGSDPATAGSGPSLLDTVGNVQRTHVLVPAIVFQNVPLRITDVAAAIPIGYRRARADRLTIRMGHTTVNQLSSTFAQNITSPLQDVLVAVDHVWFEGFGPAWVPVGLQTPFQFLPGSGNLLIEVVSENAQLVESLSNQYPAGSPLGQSVQGVALTLPATSTSQPGAAPRLRFCADRAETSLFGSTCNGSAGSTPLLGVTGEPNPGATVQVWLGDAPPNAIAACAYGFATLPPFPLLLTPLGAPGCRQYFPVVDAHVVVANGNGVAQDGLLVPTAPAAIGASVYAQYFVIDPAANALGLTASNYARLLVGL